MGTHKVYLTEEQLAKACSADKEIKAEVAAQQPELFAKLFPEKPEPKPHPAKKSHK